MIRNLLAFSLTALWAMPVDALCIYHGIDNAKTSLQQEFQDARWVVRAHVVSGDYHWPDEGEPWTLYHLKVVTSYKGTLRSHFTFFTERNSGGFYMDHRDGAVPDFDRDYLLFLVSDGWSKAGCPTARGALWVNYECGQSKPWTDVTAKEAAQLLRVG